jgi:hypothetical protein
MELSHYETVPHHVAEAIIAEKAKEDSKQESD